MSDKPLLAKAAVFSLLAVNVGLYYVFWPKSDEARLSSVYADEPASSHRTPNGASFAPNPIPVNDPEESSTSPIVVAQASSTGGSSELDAALAEMQRTGSFPLAAAVDDSQAGGAPTLPTPTTPTKPGPGALPEPEVRPSLIPLPQTLKPISPDPTPTGSGSPTPTVSKPGEKQDATTIRLPSLADIPAIFSANGQKPGPPPATQPATPTTPPTNPGVGSNPAGLPATPPILPTSGLSQPTPNMLPLPPQPLSPLPETNPPAPPGLPQTLTPPALPIPQRDPAGAGNPLPAIPPLSQEKPTLKNDEKANSPAPLPGLPGLPLPGLPVPGLPEPNLPLPSLPESGVPTPQPVSPEPAKPASKDDRKSNLPTPPLPGLPLPGLPQPGLPLPGLPQPEAPGPNLLPPGLPEPGLPLPKPVSQEPAKTVTLPVPPSPVSPVQALSKPGASPAGGDLPLLPKIVEGKKADDQTPVLPTIPDPKRDAGLPFPELRKTESGNAKPVLVDLPPPTSTNPAKPEPTAAKEASSLPIIRTAPGDNARLEESSIQPVGKTETPRPKARGFSPWTLSMEIVDGKTVLKATLNKSVTYRIRCERVEVKAPLGDVMAVGSVVIETKDLLARCERLTLPLHGDALQLEGKVQLRVPTAEALRTSTNGPEWSMECETLQLRVGSQLAPAAAFGPPGSGEVAVSVPAGRK